VERECGGLTGFSPVRDGAMEIDGGKGQEAIRVKIAKVEAIPVLLEAASFCSTYGTVGDYANVIVRVESDSGVVGVGEASPWVPLELGETQDTVDLIVRRFLAPVLVGKDPFTIGLILEHMDATVLGYPIAKAAVEMALYDLIG